MSRSPIANSRGKDVPQRAARRAMWRAALAARLLCLAGMAWGAAGTLSPAADRPPASTGSFLGPYNVTVLEGGIGTTRALPDATSACAVRGVFSLTTWIRAVRRHSGIVAVAALGDTTENPASWRGLVLVDGELSLALTPTAILRSGVTLELGQWYAVAATYDGSVARVYVNGRERAALPGVTQKVAAVLAIGPVLAGDSRGSPRHFGGSLAALTVTGAALDADAVQALAARRPDFSLVTFDPLGVGWPLQEHAWRGLQEPQDAWTLPTSQAPPSAPRSIPVRSGEPVLRADGRAAWSIDDWTLRAAPGLAADGAQLSRADYVAAADGGWYAAEVPGTVLTTLIARGVYPDPDHGLDNLAIPDRLSRQDYWYRAVFSAPAELRGRDSTLIFGGINYAAEVWLNGQPIGSITGAFTRGTFRVTGVLKPGERNALAVHIRPPPHPGIPHEQSIAAGPGENGGMLALDGPTFIAAEGWDWIPGIRDRNMGLWQGVELRGSGALRMGDPHVVTRLPLPRTDTADITIEVPVANSGGSAVAATLRARIGQVQLCKTLTLPPGTASIVLTPAEFAALRFAAPRLWWPNGYGEPNLYTLQLTLEAAGAVSDTATLRFGVREITYELSLFDHDGGLRRVEVDPTFGSELGERLIDVRHSAIKRTPDGWAASLTDAGETSAAVRPADSASLTPFLRLKVNGVPIAARGGSWGMDDSRKRSSRAHLEPFFRLQREAHLNIVRNWLGQNTEEVFYDLADEYGLLVLNDFWESTQDFQLEAEDPALFLANARDVISHYRNHPSIAVWFGRNEGVPQPIINEGLADLVATLDGTRLYTGSSNAVNLQGSGPYNYRPPEHYFTTLARGFSVEVGTPSLSTLETLRATIPPTERWPLSDTYAYHDWHFGGNGDVATFMSAMRTQYGAPVSLEDFERKAQLMDYVSYRAIFEGFAAHLWTDNSGRLLWMSHPAWPSNTWQIYTSDYDTPAAYYAVKKACEPLHAQLDLSDHRLAVVNVSRMDQPGLTLRTRVVSLANRTLAERIDRVDAAANSVTALPIPLALEPAFAREPLVLVAMTLTDAGGAVVSENVYWQGRDEASQQALTRLPRQRVDLSATASTDTPGLVHVTLENKGNGPALTAKITLLDARGSRVLPVYYSDNYVSLLPGENRRVSVTCPPGSACARVALRGWNVNEVQVPIR